MTGPAYHVSSLDRYISVRPQTPLTQGQSVRSLFSSPMYPAGRSSTAMFLIAGYTANCFQHDRGHWSDMVVDTPMGTVVAMHICQQGCHSYGHSHSVCINGTGSIQPKTHVLCGPGHSYYQYCGVTRHMAATKRVAVDTHTLVLGTHDTVCICDWPSLQIIKCAGCDQGIRNVKWPEMIETPCLMTWCTMSYSTLVQTYTKW